MLEERQLEASQHDRGKFTCGLPALDDYLHRYALQQRRKGVSSVYVLVDDQSSRDILGFYTLSAVQVDMAQLAPKDQKNLPRYPVPCFRMGRLATAKNAQGQGIGRLLVGCAVARCLAARTQVAAFALLVDAKDETSARFYLYYGFTQCSQAPLTLYLPLGAA